MATLKIKFRASSVKKKEGTLFFQVIHNRVVRQVNTGHKLFQSEWDGARAEVVVPNAEGDKRRDYLLALKESIKAETAQLKSVIAQAERSDKAFTADQIVKSYVDASVQGGFFTFTKNHIAHLGRTGRVSAMEKVNAALSSLILFYGEDELPFTEFCGDLMEEYEGWLRERGVCMNTVSFYMRTLRSVYNQAVDRGLTVQCTPFKYVYTGIDKTIKRAIPLESIRNIRDLDLSKSVSQDFARDMFMFSFYTRGMSFVDLAYLKKKDLQNGILMYRRHKTNQQLVIKWEKPMQEIVDKYDTADSPYILPIIKENGKDSRKQYRNASHLVNKSLKEVGKTIGLQIPLTTYVARHSWASIARYQNIPTATISEALGHDSEKTTRIYLASLDTSAVDRANSQVIAAL